LFVVSLPKTLPILFKSLAVSGTLLLSPHHWIQLFHSSSCCAVARNAFISIDDSRSLVRHYLCHHTILSQLFAGLWSIVCLSSHHHNDSSCIQALGKSAEHIICFVTLITHLRHRDVTHIFAVPLCSSSSLRHCNCLHQ
jgi:hypothetical protein